MKKGFFYLLLMLRALCAQEFEQAFLDSQQFVEEQVQIFWGSFSELLDKKSNTQFKQDDLLSKKDKGKHFDESNISETATLSQFEQDFETFLKESVQTPIKEEVEEEDIIFNTARSALNRESIPSDIETDLKSSKNETCQELGQHQVFVMADRKVQVEEIKKEIKKCKGHRFLVADQYKKYSDAKADVHASIVMHESEPDKKDYATFITGEKKNYKLEGELTHIDNSDLCDHYEVEYKIEKSDADSDLWQPCDLALFTALKCNQNCKLLVEEPIISPNSKEVDGISVHRDSWSKRMVYNCGSIEDPKCKSLRDKGAHLVGKLCLKETADGQCELWEKIYEHKTTCCNEPIKDDDYQFWGSSGELAKSYEGNQDIGEVLSTMSSLNDLSDEVKKSAKDVNIQKTPIFSGQAYICKQTKADNVFYDCCGKMNGGIIRIGLTDCSSDEKDLVHKRNEGKCHLVEVKNDSFIGIKNFTKRRCYCCFPTKLARVIQEEGRKQLNLSWGEINKPKCQGFSLEQFTSLNFENMDLTEIITDYSEKISKTDLVNRMKKITEKFSVDKEHIQNKMSQFTDLQSEQISGDQHE